jgi:hypothetical protein
MMRLLRAVLFWTLILCACAPGAAPSLAASAPDAPTIASTFTLVTATDGPPTAVATSASPASGLGPKFVATVSTPHIDQGPDGAPTAPPSNPQDCGYQWAQQSLPELSSTFQQSIQALQPEALANTFAFGENCVHADGTATFLPMETDFNITLHVADVSNESDLGEWIVKVMQVIQSIPSEQIVGPRPGRVTISFQSGTDQKNINFYTDQYRALQPGLSSADIFAALQTP